MLYVKWLCYNVTISYPVVEGSMQNFFDTLFAIYLFDCLDAIDGLLYGKENLSSKFISLSSCYLPYTAVILFLYALMLCCLNKKIKFKCSKNEIDKLCGYFERYEFDTRSQTIFDERLPSGVLEGDNLSGSWGLYLKLKLIRHIELSPYIFRVLMLILAVILYYGYITILLPSLPKLEINNIYPRCVFFLSVFVIIVDIYTRVFRNRHVGMFACFAYLMFQNSVLRLVCLIAFAYLLSRAANCFKKC